MKYLVTTDDWFYAPDGVKYKAAWGEVQILEDSELFGIKTNRNSTNWYAKIGSEEKHVIIAGCRIHYAVKRENKPVDRQVYDHHGNDEGIVKYWRPSHIYIAE